MRLLFRDTTAYRTACPVVRYVVRVRRPNVVVVATVSLFRCVAIGTNALEGTVFARERAFYTRPVAKGVGVRGGRARGRVFGRIDGRLRRAIGRTGGR